MGCEWLLARGRRKGTVELGKVGSRQANVERAAVLPDVRGLGRSWDRADVIAPQHPGERGLRRSGVMAGSYRSEHWMAQELALLYRRIGHNRNAGAFAP